MILISIDTCRADRLGCYGYPEPTSPRIDAFARQAVRFEHAVSPVPLTLPAHTSMLCGTVPAHHGVHDNMDYQVGPSNLTLAEIFREEGYTTAAFVSAFVLDAQFGLDQGFDTYDDDFAETHRFMNVNERRGEEVTALARTWLQHHCDEPFFLFLHYFDPHADYRPPEPFASSFGEQLYDGEIAYVDHCIGGVLDELKDLGIYDDALIVITADHGEGLGQHGENEHSFFIYQSVMHVPLVIKPPRWRKQETVSGSVGLIDIAPTLLVQSGIGTPAAMQGTDLSPAWSDRTGAGSERFYLCESIYPTKYGCNPLLGIVGSGWSYLQAPREELYHLLEDPGEEVNLASDQPARVDELRDRLGQLLHEQRQDTDPDNALALDPESRRRLESLGYVGGSVADAYAFDPARPDAKDFITYHRLTHDYHLAVNEKRYDDALGHAEDLLRRYPDRQETHFKLGRVAGLRGRHQEAIEHLLVYVEAYPDVERGRFHLGVALVRAGRHAEAAEHLEEALELDPANFATHGNLGSALLHLERFAEAEGHFRALLQETTEDTEGYLQLGFALAGQGRSEEAAVCYRKALEPAPRSAPVLMRIGKAFADLGEDPDAVRCWEEALALSAQRPAAMTELRRAGLNELAWLLATSARDDVRDPDAAVALAEEACGLAQGEDPFLLDTLAAAYAASGDFSRAGETARRALAVARDGGLAEVAGEIEVRLQLYGSGSPYRAPAVPAPPAHP